MQMYNPDRGSNIETIELSGMTIAVMGAAATIDHVLDHVAKGVGGWLLATNLDLLRRFVVDRPTRDLYERADVCVADGMPLVWASWIKGTPLPERVAGSNLVSPLCEKAAKTQRRIYLLGGDPSANAGTAKRLAADFPGLRIVGRSTPTISSPPTARQLSDIGAELEAAAPDIVFVAMGTPKQEMVIDALRHKFPSVWWIGVGATFSFIAGNISRAPLWLQRAGLEWFHRLLQEPRRLGRRYLIENLPFACYLIGGAAVSRCRTYFSTNRISGTSA